MFDLKQKAIAIALMVMMSTIILFAPLSFVQGQSGLGFGVIQVVPKDDFSPITSGAVNQAITVHGVLNTYNGQYLVYFGDTLVDNGTASGYYVASNFTIPQVVAGSYKIVMTDVALASNDTTNFTFTVNPEYIVQSITPPSPDLLQEGDSIVLNVSLTAGQPNTVYSANITVASPTGNSYSKMVSLTTSSLGTANTQLTYPDTSFVPPESTTAYAGIYTVYFNQSSSLGQSTFTIGITDRAEYHRKDLVTINAVGYQPSQTATVAITNEADVAVSSQTVTASNQGVIHATWTVPESAALGTYNVTITPQGVAKTVVDSQIFTLSGYPASFRVLNLAGASVPDILIQVYDPANNQFYNATTLFDGTATINLETGDYVVSAYWNDVKVGELQTTITGSHNYTLTCKLTDLHIAVHAIQGAQEIAVPYVDLEITIQYGASMTRTETFTAQTDSSGFYVLNSTLPNANYVIKASSYGVVFNNNNSTIANLPEKPSYQATILCPPKTLTLTTVDSNDVPLSNTRIELIEQNSGIFYSATTDASGVAQLQVVFGQYRAKIYTSDNVLLNEVIIDVFNDTQSQIRCDLYNLQVKVKVVDYFGNPISNANVQLSRSGSVIGNGVTQSDGTVTFDNVVGGDLMVTASLAGNSQSYVSKSVKISSTTTVQLEMANFVALGGLVLGVTVMATIIILAIVVVLLAVVVLYRKTRFKLQRS